MIRDEFQAKVDDLYITVITDPLLENFGLARRRKRDEECPKGVRKRSENDTDRDAAFKQRLRLEGAALYSAVTNDSWPM